MRPSTAYLGLMLAVASSLPGSAASAGGGYTIQVTCAVPRSQPERQLAPSSCLNYIPDGTQTYIARVLTAAGRPAAGVTVTWTDSDTKDANFRIPQNPCRTGADGRCQAEVRDTHPRTGEKVALTAAAGGSSATGYLTFR